MPTPVSSTSKRSRAGAPSRPSAARAGCTPPRSVNLTALPSRFSSTWRRRFSSARTAGGRPGVGLEREQQALLLGLDADRCRRRVCRNGRQVDRVGVQLELAGLDARQVEDVVDQRQQVLAALLDRRQARRAARSLERAGRAAGSAHSRGSRSAACAARGSCWRGRRSWPGWRPRRAPWRSAARRCARAMRSSRCSRWRLSSCSTSMRRSMSSCSWRFFASSSSNRPASAWRVRSRPAPRLPSSSSRRQTKGVSSSRRARRSESTIRRLIGASRRAFSSPTISSRLSSSCASSVSSSVRARVGDLVVEARRCRSRSSRRRSPCLRARRSRCSVNWRPRRRSGCSPDRKIAVPLVAHDRAHDALVAEHRVDQRPADLGAHVPQRALDARRRGCRSAARGRPPAGGRALLPRSAASAGCRHRQGSAGPRPRPARSTSAASDA